MIFLITQLRMLKSRFATETTSVVIPLDTRKTPTSTWRSWVTRRAAAFTVVPLLVFTKGIVALVQTRASSPTSLSVSFNWHYLHSLADLRVLHENTPSSHLRGEQSLKSCKGVHLAQNKLTGRFFIYVTIEITFSCFNSQKINKRCGYFHIIPVIRQRDDLGFKTCMSFGRAEFRTFDGLQYHFGGPCTYLAFSDVNHMFYVTHHNCHLHSTCHKVFSFKHIIEVH